MRPVILIDFDETLIDTTEIKRRTLDLFLGSGAKLPAIKHALLVIRPFAPEKVLHLLFPEDERPKRKFFSLFKRLGEYNYAGVELLLRRLQESHDLILLTYGDPRFQRLKIRQSGLRPFFKKVVVTKDPAKVEAIVKLKKKGAVAILDDAEEVCKAAPKCNLPAIRIRRGRKDSRYFAGVLRRLNRIVS